MSIKKSTEQNQCPKCGSEEFITEPNQYDVLFFSAGQFDIRRSESFDDYFKIFCRECASEVNDDSSNQAKRVILK